MSDIQITEPRNVDDNEDDVDDNFSEADTEMEVEKPEAPESDDDMFSEHDAAPSDPKVKPGNDVSIILKDLPQQSDSGDADTDPFFGGKDMDPDIKKRLDKMQAVMEFVYTTQLGFSVSDEIYVVDSPDDEYTAVKILHRETMKDRGFPSGYLIACRKTSDNSIRWVDSDKCLPIPH